MGDLKHQEITEKIIGAAYNVHNTLGSGFLEKVHQNSLAIELQSLGFLVNKEIPIKVSTMEKSSETILQILW